MKKIHTLTESDLNRIVKTVLESFNPDEYEDEDFVEVFLNYFRPWVKKKHGDEIGQYPLSLLIKNHINEFTQDYGVENGGHYHSGYRNMVNIGKEIAKKGVHKMPNLKKEELFTTRFKKAITFFIDRLNLPEWITLNLTEETPYVVRGYFNVDWDRAIHDKSSKGYEGYTLSDEFTNTLSEFTGIEIGSTTHGKLDLNVSGSVKYDGVDEWIKKTLNKEIKKKIRELPKSNILHTVRFATSYNRIGGSIYLTFKSNGWSYANEFTDDVRNLISKLGYNTEILRVTR